MPGHLNKYNSMVLTETNINKKSKQLNVGEIALYDVSMNVICDTVKLTAFSTSYLYNCSFQHHIYILCSLSKV